MIGHDINVELFVHDEIYYNIFGKTQNLLIYPFLFLKDRRKVCHCEFMTNVRNVACLPSTGAGRLHPPWLVPRALLRSKDILIPVIANFRHLPEMWQSH
jgi:hypothetical protein